jgi:imidazolonepropionase-like amidohydrolase
VLRAAAVTPGMIDLSVRITRDALSVEQSREVTPELRALDGLDPFDLAWEAQARSGVTAALANPPDHNVIGGLGAVVKTAGSPVPSERVVRADAVLRGSFGTEPSRNNHPAPGRPEDFYSRRPTTRMGVEWEHRTAFYGAAAAREDSERAFPGSDELVAALEGQRPFMVQAWATQDIRTAIYLKEELEAQGLGHLRLILDAAAEAWREPELLVRSGAAVVLPPFPEGGRTGDGAFMTLTLAQQLSELGVPFALSAQAGFAMRGGLGFEAALEAVTLAPARLVGVEERIGSIEAGKDADLVLWSGQPFEATSSVIGVIVDGYLVLDPRGAAAK